MKLKSFFGKTTLLIFLALLCVSLATLSGLYGFFGQDTKSKSDLKSLVSWLPRKESNCVAYTLITTMTGILSLIFLALFFRFKGGKKLKIYAVQPLLQQYPSTSNQY